MLFTDLNSADVDSSIQRLSKIVRTHPGDPERLSKEMILKRAADVLDSYLLYPSAMSAIPRPSPSNPNTMVPFSPYAQMNENAEGKIQINHFYCIRIELKFLHF